MTDPVLPPTTTPVPPEPVVDPSVPEKTIDVDIYGEIVTMPLSKAKNIIQKRDTKTKEYNELKVKITKAEADAKQEAERASLLQAMKNQNLEEIELQVSAKYRDQISNFEKKVYQGEIKSALAKNNCLGDALDDAAKLVMAEAKVALAENEVTLNGTKVDEFIKEWIAKKPHLQSVSGKPADPAKKVASGGVPKPATDPAQFNKFASTLFNSR